MQSKPHLPNAQKMSMLLASILLAFLLARLINIPGILYGISFAGIDFSIEINVNTFIALIVAALTASGADWIIRSHPTLKGKPRVENLFLPALTAWVISFPLSFLTLNFTWWIGFVSAGIIIFIIIMAEYLVVDTADDLQPVAAAVLVSFSFMLLLILIISLRSIELRLVFTLPAIGIASLLVSLRSLNLRLHGGWLIPEGLVIALIVTQFTAALHYLPLSPIAYGLLILGLIYALVNFVANLKESGILRRAAIESSLLLTAIISISLIIN